MLIVSFKIDRTLYQLHSDVLARQSDWFSAYRDQLGYDTHLLPAGWRAASTTLGTVYVHEQGDVQAERPSVIDRETGAIIVDVMTVEEMARMRPARMPTLAAAPNCNCRLDMIMTMNGECLVIINQAYKGIKWLGRGNAIVSN